MVWQGEGPLVEGDVAAAVDRLIVMVVVGCGDCNGYGGTTALVVVVVVVRLMSRWWVWCPGGGQAVVTRPLRFRLAWRSMLGLSGSD